jgi:hypothetical protein
MTYSATPGGEPLPPDYPTPPPCVVQVPPPPAATSGTVLSFLFTLGVMIVGVLTFVLGFMPNRRQFGSGEPPVSYSLDFFDNVGLGVEVVALSLLLAAALTAALGLLCKHQNSGPAVAGLSIAGFLSLLMLVTRLPEAAGPGIGLILAASFVQAGLAVGSMLFSAGTVNATPATQYLYFGQDTDLWPQAVPQPQYPPYYSGTVRTPRWNGGPSF